MTGLASGVGSMPGGQVGDHADNARAFTEATRVVLGELSLPHVPELPGRGAIASMTGRTLGLVPVGVDLQPSGWRLTDATGLDQRRAKSLLAQDLDTVEEQSQDLDGFFKTQVCGPWTLAATTSLPRGELVLADHGARRDLAQALAEAVAGHVAEVRRRVPRATVLLQLDEPALPAVLAGTIPTSSGFGRHRVVHPPEASALLETVIGATDADVVVHCCAADVPIGLIRGAGADGISVDVGALAPSAYDDVAGVVDAGGWFFAGVVPALRPAGTMPEPIKTIGRFFDMLALQPGERTVVTPTCGLAGADPAWARQALSESKETARRLGEE